MSSKLGKSVNYRQVAGIVVAAVLLTVIFVPFQKASAFEIDLSLPNVSDTTAVPTSAGGSTFEVTIDVEAGELISIESIEIILDNDENTVKRAIFDSDGQRTSGSSTLTRGNLDIEIGSSTTGYGYGFGRVSDGTTFSSPYSYAFTYSYAFISGNSIGYSNAVGDPVSGFVGPGTITISGKLNTALMEAGVEHTLDILIDTGTGTDPDHLAAPQLVFTTVGNSAIKTEDVGTGADVEVEPEIPGFAPGKFKVKFSFVNGAGQLVVHPGTPEEIEDLVGDIFTSIVGGKGSFSVGTDDAVTIGDVFDIDASSIEIEDDGTYTITVPYDEDAVPSGVDEEDLKLFHYDEDAGEWEDITTDVDTEENEITGETDSLSPVATGYTESSLGGTGGGTGGGGGGAGGTGGGKVIVNQTFPASYFETNPLKKVQISQTGFTNAAGANIVGGMVGQQISIDASFRNFQETTQPYAIIIQVVNEDGFTTDIGWTQGSLEPGKGAEASRSWTIEERGNYTIKIFVWNAVSDGPTPLSEVAQKNFSVN